ncbi:uncharacterized protein LOC131677533 [Topomyia yanbarensis]|uniref:uncharacterized protein LOC131677533 n=1 Tax=Topomyia yanbarensis TaxID=2498891 RepID=UPI00273A888B|nr:uncharacterized protein LOC131677533 [Topomyia yanbarensis]XP_058813383.1 uncharacterized protein LOC131677533 [Topomyia yanbarensis]
MLTPDVSSDWDIDAHRTYYEPTEHWDLRRCFMEKHRHWIPEDELVCLAQVFVNVELLHCRYPPATMERLAQLSAGIADEYRASRNNCLRRTFVSASDAAHSKVHNTIGPKVVARHSVEPSFQNSESRTISLQKNEDPPQTSVLVRTPTFKPVVPIRSIDDVYNNIILLDNDPNATIAAFNSLGCEQQMTILNMQNSAGQNVVKLQVGDYVLVESTFGALEPVELRSRQIICEELSKHCFKLIRIKFISDLNGEIKRHKVSAISNSIVRRHAKANSAPSSSVNLEDSTKLGEDNLGFQLLRRLGWEGGPLGQNGRGIIDPIGCYIKVARFSQEKKTDRRHDDYYIDVEFYRDTLRNFRKNGVEYDLVFSKEFTKRERRLLSDMAKEEHLKTLTVSQSKRQTNLIVLGKELAPHELLERIIIDKDPIFCNLYHVEYPQVEKTESSPEPNKHSIEILPASFTSICEKIAEPPSDFEPRTCDFRPLPEIKSISDIYHSIVLIGSNFKHTQHFFGQLNCGQLELSTTVGVHDMFTGQIQFGEHIIARVSANSKKAAEVGVMRYFMRQLRAWCYRIKKNPITRRNSKLSKACRTIHKQDNNNRPLRAKKYVTRDLDKSKAFDYTHYCNMIKTLHDTGCQYDLVFCPEFTHIELSIFRGFADQNNIKSCMLGKNKKDAQHLVVFGRPLLAMGILQHILVQKDPIFSEAFIVQHPNKTVICEGTDSESD